MAMRARKLLLVCGGDAGCEGLFAGLEQRGFELIRAATLAEAEPLLPSASLAIACPEATLTAVEQLVSAVGRARPGTPVLAIRDSQPGEPETWAALGIGVLRRPLLPDALARSVEVVLGLKRPT